MNLKDYLDIVSKDIQGRRPKNKKNSDSSVTSRKSLIIKGRMSKNKVYQSDNIIEECREFNKQFFSHVEGYTPSF